MTYFNKGDKFYGYNPNMQTILKYTFTDYQIIGGSGNFSGITKIKGKKNVEEFRSFHIGITKDELAFNYSSEMFFTRFINVNRDVPENILKLFVKNLKKMKYHEFIMLNNKDSQVIDNSVMFLEYSIY